jgi:hypothetical protein
MQANWELFEQGWTVFCITHFRTDLCEIDHNPCNPIVNALNHAKNTLTAWTNGMQHVIDLQVQHDLALRHQKRGDHDLSLFEDDIDLSQPIGSPWDSCKSVENVLEYATSEQNKQSIPNTKENLEFASTSADVVMEEQTSLDLPKEAEVVPVRRVRRRSRLRPKDLVAKSQLNIEIGSQEETFTDADCGICLLELYDGQTLHELRECKHTFHLYCLGECLNSRTNQKRCMKCFVEIKLDECKEIMKLSRYDQRQARISARALKVEQRNQDQSEEDLEMTNATPETSSTHTPSPTRAEKDIDTPELELIQINTYGTMMTKITHTEPLVSPTRSPLKRVLDSGVENAAKRQRILSPCHFWDLVKRTTLQFSDMICLFQTTTAVAIEEQHSSCTLDIPSQNVHPDDTLLENSLNDDHEIIDEQNYSFDIENIALSNNFNEHSNQLQDTRVQYDDISLSYLESQLDVTDLSPKPSIVDEQYEKPEDRQLSPFNVSGLYSWHSDDVSGDNDPFEYTSPQRDKSIAKMKGSIDTPLSSEHSQRSDFYTSISQTFLIPIFPRH